MTSETKGSLATALPGITLYLVQSAHLHIVTK